MTPTVTVPDPGNIPPITSAPNVNDVRQDLNTTTVPVPPATAAEDSGSTETTVLSVIEAEDVPLVDQGASNAMWISSVVIFFAVMLFLAFRLGPLVQGTIKAWIDDCERNRDEK